jgi:RsiW-degrading membrane proteinase PrsW (M82 family)
MAINVVCPGCARTLKAPDEAAGKQARCPHCRTSVQVPSAPPADEDAGYALLEPPPPRPSFISVEPSPPRRDPAAEPRGERVLKTKRKSSGEGEPHRANPFESPRGAVVDARDAGKQTSVPARKRSRKHWWFALTLIPLFFSLLGAEEDVLHRVEKTIAAHPEVMEKADAGEKSGAELFDLLPGGKLEGAHLSRHTWMHWVYALAAAGLFSFLILTLFERGEANVAHVLVVGITTATVGIFMLLAFQFVADLTQNLWLRGGGIVMLVFYLVKLIGFSYRAALDPANGFLSSFFGFTFGVGLCEEFTKAAPVFFKLRDGDDLGWRAACVWGLASGAGFGIAEGILYSSEHYNGVATFGIYLVRFISCVGLHAIWTGAVALMIWHNQEMVSGDLDWSDWGLAVLRVQGVPMVLHGLYDTLLKRDMNALALLPAIASFAWLAFLISRSYIADPEPEDEAFAAVA